MVFHILDDQFAFRCQLLLTLGIISRIEGITVRLHGEQFHRAVRSSGDGQRNVHRLTIGIRCTRISRDILVINIDLSLDEPVMGRNSIAALVLCTLIVTVIDDGLCAVYEVTRCLPFMLC